MKRTILLLIGLLTLFSTKLLSQSPSFETYVNPVIPGDHPDPTLTKIGDYFYTSGSSFNPTPKLYRSTNLVHWEVIAQPVPGDWSGYGTSSRGGAWGGHMVYHLGQYWHYFGRVGVDMFFTTADDPEGPWSVPTRVNRLNEIGYPGVDNSIFIDDDDRWYMLTKAGEGNNHIIELGEDGQPNGNILDLTWLNPEDEGYPLNWAEGPVMWKDNGYYYYSVAEHLAGVQYVMKSEGLTDNPEDWTLQEGYMQYGSRGNFRTPNHISSAVKLDDGTTWVIGHSYHNNWVTQGRQGLLLEITYDEDDFPIFEYPQDRATIAPALPSGGVPWMVPKSDMFNSDQLDPEWSFLGYTPSNRYSLTERPGWLKLNPSRVNNTTVIKNDGEHQYTLITRVDFQPETGFHEAGLWIFNGPESDHVKLYSTAESLENRFFTFSFDDQEYTVPNTVGSRVWFKLERIEHEAYGYYSEDGADWIQIGDALDISMLNVEQTDFNDFTGNQQGLYAQGKEAFFDLYIYRDAYSRINAQSPANFSGVNRANTYLGSINSGDWALYAGVEFGTEVMPEAGFGYQRTPDSLMITASSLTGGMVEVWLDSIDTGNKIAEVTIESTGDLTEYQTFSASVDSVSGRHDVYLRFTGSGEEELFRLQEFSFTPKRIPIPASADDSNHGEIPQKFVLNQNYPNPFNPNTVISYQLPVNSQVTIEVFDLLGRKISTLVDEHLQAGSHHVTFDAAHLSSGMYIYRITAGDFVQTKKMTLIK